MATLNFPPKIIKVYTFDIGEYRLEIHPFWKERYNTIDQVMQEEWKASNEQGEKNG